MLLPALNRPGIRVLRSIFSLAIALSPAMLFGQSDLVPNYVVNTTADDATGTASNCTSSPEGICTLRDALAAANAVSASNITFSPTVFLASNSAAANTITLANGTLDIPSGTNITGLTTGSGATLTNLVTVSGNNATSVFTVASGITGAVIGNLKITDGNNAASNGGGINNDGSLTVTGSNFIGNAVSGYGGAIYNAYHSILTVIDSNFSGNSSSAGGAIISYGSVLTVTGSTFSGNNAYFGGGAIWFGSNGTITNSTISGNSAAAGGGIEVSAGTLNIANSVVEGNTAGSSYPDIINYSTLNDLGGNLINTSASLTVVNPNLSPLGSYGGPTQTMLPEPGSAAICGGIAANIPAGVTTDQRGYPIENTTYPGYSSSTPCVDSGAVQTNYVLAFTTQPPGSATVNEAIAPAPVVKLTESGNPASAGTGSVRMTDSSNALSGTTSEGLSSGAATFPYMELPSEVNNDIFTAWLGLNPTLNISAQASVGVTAVAPTGPVPATMLSPAPGTATVLGTSNIQFQWTTGYDVTSYELSIGTNGVGSSNILATAPVATKSYTVPALPANGVTLYVRLGSLIDGAWQTEDYQYTESPTGVPATMLSPTPGTSTILGKYYVLFKWSKGAGVTSYELSIGANGAGSSGILNTGPLTTTSYSVPALPANGVTIYVRLGSLINGAWQAEDYQYTESGTPAPATMLSPTPGIATILGTSNIQFQWAPGRGVTSYELLIGTSGVGSSNFINTGALNATSYTVPALPADGVTLYVRLGSLIDGAWKTEDYQYTESTPAIMKSPTPGIGTILGASNVTFTWTPIAPVALYDLFLGTEGVGSADLYVSGLIAATSVTVPKVPYGVATDTVYVRLSWLVNETWQSIDYVYSETPSVAPALTTPTPGTQLGTSNVTFTWTPGTGPTLYDFWLGTKGVGSDNVYVAGHITTTSATAPKVPYGLATNTLYVRLWYLIGQTWQSIDYTYSETPSVAPVLSTPTPGTQLGTSNVTFTWTAGTGPTLYDFWLSNNGVGTDDLYVSGRTTATSVTAPKVPAHGATIYVRLWYLIDDTWQSTDYTYTEQ